MHIPIPITFAPDPATITEAVLNIPASRGIYALTTPGKPPHISWSINLKRRLTRLLVPSYTASPMVSSALVEKVSSVRYWKVSSRLEASLLLYVLTLEAYPENYLRRLHLRMPWFVGLTNISGFGRLEVTNRLPRGAPMLFGPFRNREGAQFYEEQVLSLHQLRRCTEALSPAPDHPGCIYGEMNQCLRPCQAVVSRSEYATETRRVSDFLETGGKSALFPLTAARERAAAELDFEQAAWAHKRIEKVQAASAARDKVIAAVQQFNGVALTRASESDSVMLWPIYAGYWQNPVVIILQQETRSLDSLLRERLGNAFQSPSEEGNRLEHMALFSHWYYSSWRDGQWFPFQAFDKLNYRKLVKGIAELLKPQSQQT